MPSNRGPVIVVEDDEAVRNSLKFSLELEGLEVRAYEGGTQLLADTTIPTDGCLVVDYYMPAMTGLELVGFLRRRHVDLPAILISAKVTDDMRRRAAQAGIRQVLEKPLEDSSLIDSIRRALDPAGSDLRDIP
jgi:two-component system, LuxR family, response regulator FixJ